MTSFEQGANEVSQATRYKRRLRNYLLDVGLQLRYTAAIVVVAVFLTGGLGWMMYQATRETSTIIEMTGMVDPRTAVMLDDEFASKDRTVLWGVIGFGIVLVVSVSGVGILITHKIAGPLFNISSICARIRDNRLGPSLRALRKGDELQEFYSGFREMHEALRKRVDEDVRVLSDAISTLEKQQGRTPEQDKALEDLRTMRREKEASLQA